MGHEEQHHEERPLSFFASPLKKPAPAHETHTHTPAHVSDIEDQKSNVKVPDPDSVPFENSDCELHENPAFQRHAEATTAELFYDLFFVANLTTFTSNLEINDRRSLTAYIGFFSLLWLTWYQVSLYDVRFSADSVFERVAKGIHFGVMVGFAVIGSQWKPGQKEDDFKIYKTFGLILMVSRITLFLQYFVTLLYSRKYKKTILPLSLVMGSTILAAILYGALTAAFPDTKYSEDEFGVKYPVDQISNVYIAWYVIAIMETIVTVGISMVMRVISFKGTHMVQRMSLLTLIILGEGIIVVCKSISKIVKNQFVWTPPVIGQVIAAILIIYFLYMSYFDRLHEEHFGSIKQQLWSFLHFPLHIVLVLVLQGISILIVWCQAVEAIEALVADVASVNSANEEGLYSPENFISDLNDTVWNHVFYYVPKGVSANKEMEMAETSLLSILDGMNNNNDGTNQTAVDQIIKATNELFVATFKTLFDSLSVSVPKSDKESEPKQAPDFIRAIQEYYDIFNLVLFYVLISGGFSLLLNAIIGLLSLPVHKRNLSGYIRLGINAAAGVGLCMTTLIRHNETALGNYMSSPWMIPTICIVMFICVLVNHVRLPKRKVH